MKLDSKFNELLARLPQPPVGPRRQGYVGHAQCVPLERGQNSGVAAENFEDYEGDDEYEGDEVQQPGRPRPHIRNGNAAPRPQVLHDDDRLAKLKLTLSLFEGRYDRDAYLTWELETEQCFACLHYPEDRRVKAAMSES